MVGEATKEIEFRALEDFILDCSELDEIEALSTEFNVFDAVGLTTHEVRHSNFLAFLLDPRESHGLRDLFLSQFLQAVVRESNLPNGPSVIDIDVWDLTRTVVRREWKGIDVLITNREHQFVVVIENKIFSGERDHQLERYWSATQREHSDYRHQLGLYLTPDGDTPSDERYVSVSYELVRNVASAILRRYESTLNPAVRLALTHYVRTLEKHVITDSEIAELCRRIYLRHPKALDLIFEHRPDRQAEIHGFLLDLIRSEPRFDADEKSYKSLIRFAYRPWDESVFGPTSDRSQWTPSGRMLLFEFKNNPGDLKLVLTLGPGDRQLREEFVEWAWDRNGNPFDVTGRVAYRMYNQIGVQQWFKGPDYVERPFDDELKESIHRLWEKFLESYLPKVVEPIDDWIGLNGARFTRAAQSPNES